MTALKSACTAGVNVVIEYGMIAEKAFSAALVTLSVSGVEAGFRVAMIPIVATAAGGSVDGGGMASAAVAGVGAMLVQARVAARVAARVVVRVAVVLVRHQVTWQMALLSV